MNRFYIFLMTISIFFLIGCNISTLPFASIETKRKVFKINMDERIGKPMYDEHLPRKPYEELVYKKRSLINNATEWYLDFRTGCKIVVTIENTTKIIKDWRYISNPELCSCPRNLSK